MLECDGRQRLHRSHRLRVFFQNRTRHADLALPLKRPFACDHFVEHGTQRKEVGPCVRFFALDLFRRHILDRANHSSRGGQRRERCRLAHRLRRRKQRRARALRPWSDCRLGQPEIHQLGAAFCQHDVPGLEIAMNDSNSLRRFQCLTYLNSDPERSFKRQRPIAQTFNQRLAI